MTKFSLCVLISFCSLCSFSQNIINPVARWRFQAEGSIRGGSVADQTNIYVGTSAGILYAVKKANGELSWKFTMGGAISSAPALLANQVIVQTRDNNIYSVNSNSGQLIWKYKVGVDLPLSWYPTWEYFQGDALVADNRIFIGAGDGFIYALSEQGKLIWKFKTNGRIRTMPYLHNGILYQPSCDGIVYALNATNGNLLWKFETEGAHLDSKTFGWDRNSIYSTPRIKDSLMVFGSRDGNTYCVNINTHKQKWKFGYGATWAMSTPAIDGNVVYIGWSDVEFLTALDLQKGKELWRYKTNGLVFSDPQLSAEQLIVGSSDHKLHAIDKSTGSKIWEYRTGGSIFGPPLIDGTSIFVGNDRGELIAVNESEKPALAIFHPISATRFESMAYDIDPKITAYFKEKGFQQIDSMGLVRFINNRLTDKTPSVIVFGYKYVPSNIMGKNDPSGGLLRKYLEAGGKVLWMADPPNFITYNKKGEPALDEVTASRALDVDFQYFFETGNYPSQATQEGINWGIPRYATLSNANVGSRGITPLAIDEYGRITSWLKRFSARPGSGFVFCMPWGWNEPIDESHLNILYQLAIYGLK